MSKKTKQDSLLTQLISEFENSEKSFSQSLWEEKSYFKLIHFYEKHKHYDKALEVVDMAINTFKYRAEFIIQKGKILLFSQRPEEALDVLSYASHYAPYDIEIPLLKAKALCLLRKIVEAKSLIDDVKRSSHLTDLTEILLVEAFIHESMKDYDKMFYTLKEVLETNPNNTEALEQIWVSVEFSKKYEESIRLHKDLIDQNPYSYLAWYNLGHAYSCLGEYEKAIEAMEYAFLINPSFEQGYLDCAELCLQLSKYKQALDCFIEANEIFGPDSEIIVNMAECYVKLGRHNEAKIKLLQAADQDPFNDEIFFYLGECYAHENNWRKAINYYNLAIDIDECREEFHASLAAAYEAIGSLKKAEVHYRKAANCGQEQSQYWAKNISFLLKNQLLDKASKRIQKAERVSFGADILFCKAACSFMNGDRPNAFNFLEEALDENSDCIHYLYDILPELKADKEVIGMVRYFTTQ
ncbi:MAG: tetratricopeptide repeat protein [Bacteroidota bacterium]|nr:tetratricopeptide repeat protein [Bacteroidota bacterium]